MLTFDSYDKALETIFGETKEAKARYDEFLSNKVPEDKKETWRGRRKNWQKKQMREGVKRICLEELGGNVEFKVSVPEDFGDSTDQ